MLTPTTFALDDTYIALHSAKVVLTGHDAAYGSAALVGATSPPYVALMAVLLMFHLPAEQLASALGLVAFATGLWTLGCSLRLSKGTAGVLVLLTLATGYTLQHSLNGIETGWALAAVTWLIVFVLRDMPTGIGCAAGLLPVIRPDLAPTAGLVLLYALWARSWSERVRIVTVAVAVGLPWLVWVRVDTGYWLPQTMRAKQFWFAEACWPMWRKLDVAIPALRVVGWQLLPFAYSLILLSWTSGLGRVGLLATTLTLGAYVVGFPGGLLHNWGRYPYAIVVPWAAFGLARLFASHQLSPRTRWVAVAAFAAFILYAKGWTVIGDSNEIYRGELAETAAWIETHTPEDAVILVHDAGFISERTHRRLVDIVGLKTLSSIDAHAASTWPSCGDRSAALGAIARRSEASYAVVLNEWDRFFSITSGLDRAGYDLELLRHHPGRSIGFNVFRLTDRNTTGRE